MANAVYTGGTLNVAAIKTALGVSDNTYMLFNTYDTVFSLIYIFFMASIARAFFQKVFRLRPFTPIAKSDEAQASDISDESVGSYGKMLKLKVIKGLLLAFLLSAVFLAIAYVVGDMVPDLGDAVMGSAHEGAHAGVVGGVDHRHHRVQILEAHRLGARFLLGHVIDAKELVVAEQQSIHLFRPS
jgi:uncharacterized membrane protein